MTLAEVPTNNTDNLPAVSTTNGERPILSSCVPIRNEAGKILYYKAKSPRGQVEFDLPPNSVELTLLRETFVGNTADQLEVMSMIDLSENLRIGMQRLGLSEENLPHDPTEILRKGKELIIVATEIQQAKTQLEQANAAQAMLKWYQDQVLRGNRATWFAMNPVQREWALTFSDVLTIEILKQMGVNEQSVVVAEFIKDIDKNLRERKNTAMIMAGLTAGQTVGNAFGGLVESFSKRLTGAFLGKENAEKGLIGGSVNATGEAIEGGIKGAVRTVKDAIAEAKK